ncbi:DUF7007 domain-containing protein [Leucobacter sp. HY1910]
MSNINRHSAGAKQAGQSVGGQFAATRKTEASGAGLAGPAPDQRHWGETGVAEGSHTPWGKADQVNHPAPGISVVHTPSHGGVKLSPERNREIPAALRESAGWYEEDCDAAIPLYYFTDDMAGDFKSSPAELRAGAAESIRNWHPDGWTQATGETVSEEDSVVLRRRAQREREKDQFAAWSVSDAQSRPDHVLVKAKRASDGAEAEFLVPREEYRAQQPHFVADEARHPQLPPAQKEPEPANTPVAIPDRLPDSITGAARTRINKDLDQRWRSSDGSVRSLHQILESDGAHHRAVYVEGEGANIKFRYAVVQADHSSYRVSKATFDFLDSVPDERTPADLQREDSLRKEAKLRKVEAEHRHSRNLAEAHRAIAPARAALLESQEKYLALRREQEAVEQPLREARSRAREADQLHREQQATLPGA